MEGHLHYSTNHSSSTSSSSLLYRTTLAVDKLCDILSNTDLFGPVEGNSDGLEIEENEVFGTVVNNTTSDKNNGSNSSDYDSNVGSKPMSLDFQILFEWKYRKQKIDHKYNITDWSLGVIHTV